jgi:DNA-binding GntR family transcriptional regulator
VLPPLVQPPLPDLEEELDRLRVLLVEVLADEEDVDHRALVPGQNLVLEHLPVGPAVVEHPQLAGAELLDREVREADAGIRLAGGRERPHILDVRDDHLDVAVLGVQVDVLELLADRPPEQRIGDRRERRDAAALEVGERLRIAVRGHADHRAGDVVLADDHRLDAALLDDVRDLERPHGDDVGVAAGVDPELVPRRGVEDLDPGFLLHLLPDPLIGEPAPHGVGRERESDHVAVGFPAAAVAASTVVAAPHPDRGHHRDEDGHHRCPSPPTAWTHCEPPPVGTARVPPAHGVLYTVLMPDAQALETRTLAEQVSDRLRDDVLSGRLPAGQRLSQEALAEQFQVSRVPIRDALRELEAEGLVVSYPRAGMKVADLSADDLEELYDMRLALEPVVARLATPRVRAADLATMRKYLDVMSSSGELSADWFSAHAKFHSALNDRSDRVRMCRLCDSLRQQTERYVRVFRFAIERADELGAEHELIYEAASGGDAEAVAAEVYTHLALVRDRVLAYLRAHRLDAEGAAQTAPPPEDPWS